MIHMSASNTRRTKNHELVVREDGKAYKAIILCENRIRIEGAEAATPKEALEVLLTITAQMLEVASETWEEGYAGEEVVERGDGSRVAKEREVEPGVDDAMMGEAEDGEENADDVATKSKAVVKAKTPHKPGFTYTGRRGRPKKSLAAEVAQVIQPKRRGRPPKEV